MLRLEYVELPHRSLTWITAHTLVAVGFGMCLRVTCDSCHRRYDYVPVAFAFTGSELKALGKIDVPEKKAAKATRHGT